MLKRFSTFLAASALVTLAACGGESGPDFASEISESDMEGAAGTSSEMLNDVINGILSFNYSMDLPLEAKGDRSAKEVFAQAAVTQLRARALARAGRPELAAAHSPRAVAAPCEAVYGGELDEFDEPVDSDGDEVPNDFTVSFPAGCFSTEGDWKWSYSGSLRFRDVAGLFGFRVDANDLRYREWNDVTGEEYSFTVDGMEQGVYAAAGITHAADFSYRIFQEYDDAVLTVGMQAAAPVRLDIRFEWNEDASFDPEGTISLESPIGNGDFDLDLEFRAIFAYDSDEGSEDAAFRFRLTTPDPLHYNTACESDIDDGTLRGELNGNDEIYFLIDWTGCGTSTYETHGTTDGGAPAVARR